MTIALIKWKAMQAAKRTIFWVRQFSGDASYENYLRSVQRGLLRHRSATDRKPLSPLEFYLDSARRRYSTPSRCC
ncbi:MAG: CstA-like transporter-associated (seleno)protein [Candidatus Acidiferrales bacterium]